MGWGDVEEGAAVHTVEAAHQLGIEWYDVADVYGLGSALLRTGTALRGVDRASFKLILKLGYFSPEHRNPYEPDVLQSHFERSLRALGTDYVDICSFHNLYFGPNNVWLSSAIDRFRSWLAEGTVKQVGWRTGHRYTARATTSLTAESLLSLEQQAEHAIETAFPDGPLHYKLNLLSNAEFKQRMEIRASGKTRIFNKPFAQGLLAWPNGNPPKAFPTNDHRHYRPSFSDAAQLRARGAIFRALESVGLASDWLMPAAIAHLSDEPNASIIAFGAKSPVQVRAVCESAGKAREISTATLTELRRAIMRELYHEPAAT